MVEKKYDFHPEKDFYISRCDLCTEIRFFLSRHRPDKFSELQPKGFYSSYTWL
jgi:hypothetical protein